jgi:hypothetical protein
MVVIPETVKQVFLIHLGIAIDLVDTATCCTLGFQR